MTTGSALPAGLAASDSARRSHLLGMNRAVVRAILARGAVSRERRVWRGDARTGRMRNSPSGSGRSMRVASTLSARDMADEERSGEESRRASGLALAEAGLKKRGEVCPWLGRICRSFHPFMLVWQESSQFCFLLLLRYAGCSRVVLARRAEV